MNIKKLLLIPFLLNYTLATGMDRVVETLQQTILIDDLEKKLGTPDNLNNLEDVLKKNDIEYIAIPKETFVQIIEKKRKIQHIKKYGTGCCGCVLSLCILGGLAVFPDEIAEFFS